MKSTIVSIASLVMLLLGTAYGGTATLGASVTHNRTKPTIHRNRAAQALPAPLRPALYGALAKSAARAAAPRLDSKGCATLPKQALKVCFDEQGAHFSWAGSSLALRLEARGRAGDLDPVHPVKPTITGKRINYAHGNLTAWWQVLPMGFEQGFTIAERPRGQGELTLVLSANRKNVGVPQDGVLAWGKLRYGKLVVTDAQGKVVPATLKTKGDRVLIAVNDSRAVYPLTVDPVVWLEQKVVASDGAADDGFSYSVAVDGTTALVGSPYAIINGQVQGAVYVFTKSNGTWSESQKLVESNGHTNDGFGSAVALDGSTALIGAVGDAGFRGAVYVFTESNGTWRETQKLTASDAAPYDTFGKWSAVALDGTTALIGAPGATVNGVSSQGAAYVFTESGGTWTQTAKLTMNGLPSFASFGASVALDGTTALIGTPSAGSFDQGATYVFTESNGSWSETQKLTSPDSEGLAQFGNSLALDGTTALIGEFFGTVNGISGAGAAYVFTEANGNWSEAQKLVASDPGENYKFGKAVALDGTTAIVGSFGANVKHNTTQGTAYVFTESNGHWSETQQLVASDGAKLDQYGVPVAFDGTTALVGHHFLWQTIAGAPQGSAYFYGKGDLGLAVSAPGKVGQGANYVSQTIATNNANVASPAVAVSVTVPVAASFISATATQGSCSENSGVVACNFGSISGDAGTASANVKFKVTGDGGDAILNTASVPNATPLLAANTTVRVNTPPVAKDSILKTFRNKAANGVLTVSDADGDPLTFSIITPPAHGQIELNNAHKGFYTYTPEAGYVSGDSFKFKANDGYNGSNVATVVVNVVNRPPVANDGNLTADENAPANGTLQAKDPDGDSLTYSIVAPPGHGSLKLDATTGGYTYTPAADYFGADGFTFKANDGQDDSNTATISITVAGSAPPPPPPPPSKNSGGGSFGGLLLMLLAVLATAGSWLRHIGRKPSAASNGETGRLEPKRKETNMRIRGKWATATAGMLALSVIVGVPFMPTSSAAPGHSAKVTPRKPSGLTNQSIKIARKSGMPSRLVKMAPQSSVKAVSHATKIGPHAFDSIIKLTVALKLRNETKLKSFLEQVQNPTSALYHHWLTPAGFARLYGPTKADVARVVAFLKARDITVLNVSSNRMLIHTKAKSGVYEQAFSIRINDYKLNGRRFYSTTDRPRLPRALAPLVVNILGLNHGVQMRPISLFQRPLMSARGLSPLEAPPASLTDLNPLQIAHAYNYPDITDATYGQDVNVAILTAQSSGLEGLSDPHDFWAAFGLPDHTVNVIPVDGDSGATNGMGETLLDVEYSGAMGPGITQNVYVADDATLVTFIDMYNQFANDTNSGGTARNQVMTTSWGAPDIGWGNLAITADQIFKQAAAEGISMFSAAGDKGSGDGTAQDNVADYPSSSLYITAANGTQLNISDLAGDYGSEVVWNDAACFGLGPASTGGAVSQLFDKPDWQQGPGVPTDIDMRMNSDMAATASCTKPMLVLEHGKWALTAGTSAVAPQLAGLFAIAVARNGYRLGQSNELIYADANSHYASDFHDVTEGNNGAFEAGPNWDHPTGWGSPNAQHLISHIGIQGPAGTLSGKVTTAATGSALRGAKITVVSSDGTERDTRTGKDGIYSRLLPVGDFSVRVSDYGYSTGTASVSIVKDQTTTEDFALNVAPQATLSGEVTDGSGHGYGLYADIKISTEDFGQVADVWTNPVTGKYSVKLPKGITYTLNVAAAFDGYNTASKTVTLSSNKSLNVPLTVTSTCSAPGYRFKSGGFGQDFNGSAFPPAGWAVEPAGGSVTWVSISQDSNYTGGTGNAAGANISFGVFGYDTSLVTPPISVTMLHGATLLRYKANYQEVSGSLDLDISTDEGTTWTTIKQWTASHGASFATPGANAQADLAPYLPTSGEFKLRWRYHSQGFVFQRAYAQIDDVVIGSCVTAPGAPIFGQVSDYNTGEGLVGAKVEDETGNATTTIVNPADPNLPIGAYEFFESAGDHTLTARYPKHSPGSASLSVGNNKTSTQDFELKAGQLTATPKGLTLHVMVNNVATPTLTLDNTGSGDAHFIVAPINGPPPASAQATGPFAIIPHYAPKQDLSTLTANGMIGHQSQRFPPIRHAVPHAAGDVISRFSTKIPIYGLGVDRNTSSLWLGSIKHLLDGDDKDHRFLFDGTETVDSIDVSNPNVLYMADMAFDYTTGTLWQLSEEGILTSTSSHIFELDPATDMPTGKSILVPSPQSERGLAYDPLSNTWYAGDFNSETIYHFNASGTLLQSVYVGLPITGLAYNVATGHLFVLTSNGKHAIYVIDVKHDYDQVGSFDIDGFNPIGSGAGLGFDCDGDLWISDSVNQVVWEVASGESGWCSEKFVPWLTVTPEEGTVSAGSSTNLQLAFDGTGQKEFTTSQAYLSLASNTPYPNVIVPLKVTWDPQLVNLSLAGEASPIPVRKGDTLLYTLTVYNRHANNHGAASQTKLSYTLPDGVQYKAASGDGTCTVPPPAGSLVSPASAAGSTSSANKVTCDFGTIALGDSKTETLAVKAAKAGKLTSNFDVSAREPESNGSDNHLSLTSMIIGTADLGLSANSVSIPAGGTGTMTLTLKNAGPDPASEVQIHTKPVGTKFSLQSFSTSQGSCDNSGGSVACKLGQVDAGDTVTVKLNLFGISEGSATVNAQASTASDEPNPENNGVSATVTVKAPPPPHKGGNNGGGTLGWLALAALMSLVLYGLLAKQRDIR